LTPKGNKWSPNGRPKATQGKPMLPKGHQRQRSPMKAKGTQNGWPNPQNSKNKLFDIICFNISRLRPQNVTIILFNTYCLLPPWLRHCTRTDRERRSATNNNQQTTNNKQQTTTNKQHTTFNKQQTNTKQPTMNNKWGASGGGGVVGVPLEVI